MSFVGESFNAEMGKYEDDILSQADTLILGRVTYESFAGSWPSVPSEDEKVYARKLNAMRKIEEDGRDILIYGSASIVQQFSKLGLIDEYQLLVHPVVLGGGKQLFTEKLTLKFVSAKPFTSGVVFTTYVPAASGG
jgi:dihydrofolate reductase